MDRSFTHPTRRRFAAALGASTFATAQSNSRPNILWITCEDTGPQLGCYGDAYATTPNLDRFATESTRYLNAWSNAPVCAPARTTIISGMYPTSTGSEHMRSMTSLPPNMKMFPCYLREAGYYTSNNVKEDYNLLHTGKVWDESSNRAHWRKRAAGQPFFSVFNFTITHESQIRRRPHTPVHDPAKARIPAYHPDTAEVRRDWAQYYDNITTMDGQAGEILKALKDDGLAEDTIVFFYGDHGSGMPRSKRWPYNSGLHVPMIVRIPEKHLGLASAGLKRGGTSKRPVSFVDLAPTVLSLAGVKPASHMQGHAFLGQHQTAEQRYIHGFRGRMDERYDLVRTVRDTRYVYVRNYMPHKIYGQHIAYMFDTPTTTVWKKLYDEGKLRGPQTKFWETKPSEELYDLDADCDEIHNVANSAEHQATLQRLRSAHEKLALDVRDVGFLPENEIHARSEGSTPFEMGHDETRYPVARVMRAADRASSPKKADAAELGRMLQDPDSGVRYWATLGILMRGPRAVESCAAQLTGALKDKAPSVRIAAAEALGRYGAEENVGQALETLFELAPAEKNGVYVSLLALNAIDAIGPRAKSARAALQSLSTEDPKTHQRMSSYVPRIVKDMLSKD